MAGSKFSLEAILSLTDQLTGPYKKSTQKVTALNKGLTGSFGALNSGINKTFIGGAKLAGGAFVAGVGLASVAIKSFTAEASKIEDAKASFTPLLGSVEKATQLVNRLNKEAASTPFQFEGISSVAKQLLPVMNGSIEDTADTFRMLGDTAGGNIQKLETITRGYTKALLKGKPDLESLNMISEAGVPIFAEMSKNMGITTKELFAMSSAGKLTNDNLTDAFKAMTKEGGVFYKGMEIASQTLTGRISTLKDNISLTAASIGSALLPVIKSLTDKAIVLAQKIRTWVDANQELIAQKLQDTIKAIKTAIESIDFNKIINNIKSIGTFIYEHRGAIKALVITLGLFKAAVILVNAAMLVQKGLMVIGPILSMVKVFTSLAATEGIVATAQLALNTAMAANPVGVIIIGIMAAIAALVALGVIIYKNRDAIAAFFVVVKDLIVNGFMKIAPILEVIGKGFMTYLLAPVNLVIEAIQGLLTLISKIPGVGDALKPAIDSIQSFQDGMNKVTLLGRTNTTNTTTNEVMNSGMGMSSMGMPQSAMQAIEREKVNSNKEKNQRFDYTIKADKGYSLYGSDNAPVTAVNLGNQ